MDISHHQPAPCWWRSRSGFSILANPLANERAPCYRGANVVVCVWFCVCDPFSSLLSWLCACNSPLENSRRRRVPKLFSGTLGICHLSGRNLSLHKTCDTAQIMLASSQKAQSSRKLWLLHYEPWFFFNLFERAFDSVDGYFYGSCTLF